MPQIRAAPTFVADAVGNRDAVSAFKPCRWIRIREIPPSPTADYVISDVASGGNEFRRYPGEDYTFEGPFQESEIAGYIATISGTATFTQEEGLN